MEYMKLLLEDETQKVNIGVGVIRKQQEAIKEYKQKESQLELAKQKILQLESELTALKEQHDHLSAEHDLLRLAMNQMNATHRVEMDSAQGVVNVLKGRLEQKLEETKKLEKLISESVDGPNVILCDKVDTALQPGQIKEFVALKSSIDATREKIDNLLNNTNGKSNEFNLKVLFAELNEFTVRLLDNLVKQLSEERHYSSAILNNLTDELSNVDLLIETIQNLSHQSSFSSYDDRRVAFSFVVPESTTDLTMHSLLNGK